ncbi:MAG: lysine exporter LysO family protein [Bacteroides sp.]|nr:lysine exporter LysO family protein [Bacteroides sp.]
MLVIIAIMFAGILTGYLFRRKNLRFIPTAITVFIWLLLFLLGIEVGNNQTLINSLSKLGAEAMILTLGAVAGSICLSWLLWYVVNRQQRTKNV